MHAIKELKVPLSCRIAPDLKAALEFEASKKGMTTSMYLVSLLEIRLQPVNENVNDNMETYTEEIERLQKYIADLEEETEHQDEIVSTWQQRIDALQSEKAVLKKQLEQVNQKWSDSPVQMLNDLDVNEKVLFTTFLEELSIRYPDLPNSKLLLASLHTSLQNEKSTFWIHTIAKSLDFLTAKTESL